MYLMVMVGIVTIGLGLVLLMQQQQPARIFTNVRADRIAWTRRSGRLVRKVPLA